MFAKKSVVFFIVSLMLTLSLFFISAVAHADDPDTEPPTAPANLVTTAVAKNSISISWDASTDNIGVTGYNIYNGDTLAGTVTLTSFTFSNLSPGTQYTFGVEAKDAAGNVSARTTLNCYTLLAEPANIAVVRHTTAIDISWSAVESAETYEVKVNGNVVSDITATSYTYRGLTPGSSYSIQVRGMNADTSGTWSATVSGTTYASTAVSGTISQDTTWSYDNSPYDIGYNSITINSGVTLTIDPGVVVKAYYRNSASIVVSGILNALGTSDNGILFTSTNDPDYGGSGEIYKWPGIEINSTGEFNADYITLKYVGKKKVGTSWVPCDVIKTSGKLSLSNSTAITYSSGCNFIYIDTASAKDITLINNIIHFTGTSGSDAGMNINQYNGGTLTALNNTIINDGTQGYQLRFSFDTFKPTTIDGLNGYSKVLAYGSTINQNLSLPQNYYEISSAFTVSSGATLNIDPGAVLKLNTGSSASIVVSGALNANGTDQNPVIFTSNTDPAYGGSGGYVWYGINITSSGEFNANYIKIKYAGGYYSTYSWKHCDVVNTSGKLNLSNSEIINSYGNNGIYINTASAIDVTLTNNIIHFTGTSSSNAGFNFAQYNGGILTSQNNTIINDGTEGDQIRFSIDTFKPTTINGLNGYDKVRISASSSPNLSQDLTLPQNYYLLSSEIDVPVGITLTLTPGTVIISQRGGSGGATIKVSGILNAYGTPDDPIVFTSVSDSDYGGSGTIYWAGIDINSTGQMNAEYIKIKYAGATYGTYSYGLRKALMVNGELNLSNSEISYTYSCWAIYVSTTSKDINLVNNIIHFGYGNSSNAGPGIYFSQFDGGNLTAEGNTVIDDADEGGVQIGIEISNFKPNAIVGLSGYENVNIYGNTISQNLTLPQNNYGAYLITVPSGLTLTLEPGTVMRLGHNDFYTFDVAGTLNAIGTAENPIVFTSPGDTEYGGDNGYITYWPGFNITSTGEINIDNAIIKYAGAQFAYARYYGCYIINDSGRLSFTNSEISYGFKNSEIAPISRADGIYVNTTIAPTIRYNAFTSMGYGVYNANPDSLTVNAKYNYWGSNYGPVSYDPHWFNKIDPLDGCSVSSGVLYSPYFGFDLSYMHKFGKPGAYGPSGSFGRSYTDLSVSNSLQSVAFTRTYNSLDDRADTCFGRGWTFNFEGEIKDNQSLVTLEEGGIKTIDIRSEKIVRASNGAVYVFTVNSNGTFKPKDIKSVKFVKNANGTYTLTARDQTKYNYDSGGKMTSVVDKYGNAVTIGYTGDKISSIVDCAGNIFSFTYNEDDKVTEIEDESGNRTVAYEYDENGRLIRATDPTGAVTRYAYDGAGFLDEVRDHDNNLIESVEYGHTAGENKDKISETTDAYGNTVSYYYDNVNRVVTTTDSNGRVTRQWYDSSLSVTKEQDPEGGYKTTAYNLTDGVNKYGEIASVTDRNGNVTSYVWDANGNNTQITNPDGGVKRYTYDDKNNLTSVKDENNKTTYLVYDAAKVYLMKKAQPLDGTTAYDGTNDSLFAITGYEYYSEAERVSLGYEVKGLLKAETDPEGGVTAYTYDSNGNYAAKTNALNKITSYTYNAIGWLMEEVSPKGYRTNYTYNKNGVQLKKVLDGGETYRTVYNKEGRVVKDILPNLYDPSDDNISNDTYSGNCGTRYTYYASGEVMTITNAEGNATGYTYDDYGNVDTETNPGGAIFRYEYDGLNRITKKYYKEGAGSAEILLEEYTYTILTNKQTRTTVKKYIDGSDYVTEKKTYDYANRLVETENPDSTTTATVYNANGTVQRTTDTNGKSTHHVYDGLNRLAEKWVPFELRGADIYYAYTSYTYDRCGRKLEEKYGKELVLLNNRPAQFITTSYEYYADGSLEAMATSAGAKTEYAYDNDGVLSREKKYYDASGYYQTDYTNNYWGKPSAKEAHVMKGDIFGYDFSDGGDHVLTTSYTYDDNGNLETETDPNSVTTTYGYDNLSRQTSISQPGIDEYRNSVTITTSKDYDYAGNVISETDANSNETAYEYNGLGHQIRMTDAGGGVTLKRYDHLGRMTAIVSPTNYLAGHALAEMNRTEYAYDPMGRVKTMSQIYYDTSISQWKSYVSGAYKYDNKGNVVKELSGLGYAAGAGGAVDDKIDSGYGTVSTYNCANLKLTTLDPVSSDRSLPFTMEYSYDALGRKIAETNAHGNITKYHYDDSGNVTSVSVQKDSLSSEQVIRSMTYDKLGNVLTATDGNGNTTTSAYNALGKVRTATAPGDSTIDEYAVSSQYDGAGNQVYTFDNIYTEKFMTYDNQGRQLSLTERKNDDTQVITTSAAYDKNGNKRFETNGNGDVKENAYDALNRLESATVTVSGMEQTTSYTYDANNNLLTTTDWRGNVTANEYDPLNRITAKKDANDVYIERLTYNINDAQVSSTDALGNTTSYTYDKSGRPLTTTDSGDHVTGKTYDDVGNVETAYDGENNTTRYSYDEFNRLVKVTDPESGETSFTYDLNGNLLTQTDGSGHVKTMEYNAVNKLIRSIDHGGRTGTPGSYVYDPAKTVSYAYYKNGLVHTMTDRNGEVTTYAYDCHDRMFLKNINSVSISFTYDNVGNQLTVSDATGTTARTYDELNRVLTKTVPAIGTAEYTYDITSGLPAGYAGEEYTDPAGNTVLKVYDKAGRLHTVTDGTDVTTYAYYDNGARQSVTYGNGAKEEYEYIEGSILSELINRRPDGSVMDQYTYAYDGAHNMLTKYEVINDVTKGTTTYTYDTLNRLLTVTEPGGRATAYTYDGAGNRETETIVVGSDTTVKTYVYNEQNRLENVEEQMNGVIQNLYEYGYDNNGNQLTTARTPYVNGIPQSPSTEVTNGYDDFNQLTQSVKGGITSTYGYNGEGLRTIKTVDTLITRYLYEYSNVILETDNTGNETTRNIYGINLLKREVGADSYYYFYNGHADVTALMNTETDTIDASYYYDAFGNILESTGSVSNNIKYAGYQYDEETGYYYLNSRMYDPITARFLQEDTVTGDPNDPLSLNLYTYGRNNPLIYTDPTGHFYYIGNEQVSNSTPEEVRKKKETKIIVEKYWNSDKANKDPHKDHQMLLLEADIFGYVKTQDFGENDIEPLKPLPRAKALAMYRLAADSLTYDEDNLDRLAIEQLERLTGSYHANEYLTSKDIIKLIKNYDSLAPWIKDFNTWCWEHREACKFIVDSLNAVTLSTMMYSNYNAYYSPGGYGAPSGTINKDIADAEVASGNRANRGDYGDGVAGGTAGSDNKAIVIGEGMGDVKAVAKQLQSEGVNAKWYQAWSKNFPENRPMTPDELNTALSRNQRWIDSKIKQGYDVYDIGIDPLRTIRSPFYQLEQIRINNYGYPPIDITGRRP